MDDNILHWMDGQGNVAVANSSNRPSRNQKGRQIGDVGSVSDARGSQCLGLVFRNGEVVL